MERGNQKSRVFAKLQSLELRLVNQLRLFNSVFQKFTHAHAHTHSLTHTQIRINWGMLREVGSGPAPSGHWKVRTLRTLLPGYSGVGRGGREYLERTGTQSHPREKGPKVGTSQISLQIKSKQTKNRGSGISKKSVEIRGGRCKNCTRKKREKQKPGVSLGIVPTPGLGPSASKRGRVCLGTRPGATNPFTALH